MANLSFMSELTDEQRQYAEVIRSKAREMGVPPELAVAVAYQESRLNPRSASSPAGAMGIMQVRPIAAREVGVDPSKLQDPNTNIDAGLRYLQKALNETGDPRLAVIYYNAGPRRLMEFDRGGDLPKETETYLRSLKAYGAFNPPAEQPAAEPVPEAPAQAASQQGGIDFARIQKETEQSANDRQRLMAQLVGFGAGATLSGARAGVDLGAKGVQGAGKAFGQGMAQAAAAAAPGGAPAGLPGAPAGPGAPGGPPQSVVRVQPPGGSLIELGTPGTYPRATGPGSGTFNYARNAGLTEIEAGRALDMTKQAGGTHDLLTQRREALNRIAQMGGDFRENQMFGGLMTPVQGVGSGPRQSFVAAHPDVDPQAAPPKGPPPLQALPPRAPVPTTPPPAGALEQVTQTFKRMADTGLGMAGRAMRYVAPPLAMAQGAGELIGAKQAMQREQPDYLEAALRGLGGTAAVASAFTPAALPVAVGAPLAQAFRERMAENARRFPADTRPLTPEEEERASRPVTFYRTGDRRFASRP